MKRITLKYYNGEDSQCGPEHNWEVYLYGLRIGQVHSAGGSIGGEIGPFTETDLFDNVCELAKIELFKINDKVVQTIESKVLDLMSYLDIHGDECTEDLYSSLDNYIARLSELRQG